MKPSEKVWWTKVAAAVGVAILTLVMQVYFNLLGQTAFMLGTIIYLALSDILSSMNGIERKTSSCRSVHTTPAGLSELNSRNLRSIPLRNESGRATTT